jgi:hypothetical protein
MAGRMQRKAAAVPRRRALTRGLVRVEVQAPRRDAALIRTLAETLCGEADKAKALRSTLENVLLDSESKTAFDVFGSDLPDDAFAGIFDRPRAWSRSPSS